MNEKIKRYFNAEFELLDEYKEKYSSLSSMYNMKADKIKGAIHLAEFLDLLSYEEIQELRTKLHSI